MSVRLIAASSSLPTTPHRCRQPSRITRQRPHANRHLGHASKIVITVIICSGLEALGVACSVYRERAIAEITEEAAKHYWRIFDTQIPFSRGFPKMMRGDYRWLGNASDFSDFAEELSRALLVNERA